MAWPFFAAVRLVFDGFLQARENLRATQIMVREWRHSAVSWVRWRTPCLSLATIVAWLIQRSQHRYGWHPVQRLNFVAVPAKSLSLQQTCGQSRVPLIGTKLSGMCVDQGDRRFPQMLSLVAYLGMPITCPRPALEIQLHHLAGDGGILYSRRWSRSAYSKRWLPGDHGNSTFACAAVDAT